MAESENMMTYDQGYNKTVLSENSSNYQTIITEDTFMDTSR